MSRGAWKGVGVLLSRLFIGVRKNARGCARRMGIAYTAWLAQRQCMLVVLEFRRVA